MSESSFRHRFDKRDPICGIFVKTPNLAVIETLADTAVDFIVLDQEHAPFDREMTDILLFSARALGLPALVRVASGAPDVILAVLDGGAAGVLVPHVADAAIAQRVSAACRYRMGRGYSGAVRSTRNRGGLTEATGAVDREIVLVAQIEDRHAIDQADAIAACEGVDALFIGRGDLAVSLQADSGDAAEVWKAAKAIAAGAAAHRKPVWAFASNWDEADRLIALGARAIIFGSDQSHLKAGISELVGGFGQRKQDLLASKNNIN